ncbi:slowpoke-binding protein [Phthorimaea operculella]|nr:slowpoke-binding protein [Phthorimaea operculella]
MFNLYQHMKNNSEGKEQKEPETTGHDRFYQERTRSSYRKKKRRGACRRAQSAAELNPESIAAANKRNAFRIRSVSTDREESEGKHSNEYYTYPEGTRSSYRKKKRRGACRRAQSAAELNPESIAAANKRNAFRIRSSYRKKKRRGACRRAQSAAELNPESIAAANKRNAFRIRSVSTDREESEDSTKQDDSEGSSFASSSKENSERAPLVAQKIDSLAKLLFNKSIIGTGSGKSSPSEAPASPKIERTMESSAALAICTDYLLQTPRYELLSQLCAIGARPNKHWFAIHDNSIKTDRLLTLMPLTNKCPIDTCDRSRGLILELFRALHHPYIYPVLDLELTSGHALTVMPFNARGSLKDLIYKSTWNEEYSRKYGSVGTGLPAWQVARFGRQMLEGLLFLKEKGFPPFRHLHSGNVVVQNGVARICGLENTLIGALPRCPIALAAPLDNVEALSLGSVLYEMCAGAELDLTLLSELLPDYAQVVEIIEMIFGPRTPTLHELLLCELFRKIDLREMKGSCLPNFNQRLSRSCLSLLGEVARRQPYDTLEIKNSQKYGSGENSRLI